jgi:hypothetical protein
MATGSYDKINLKYDLTDLGPLYLKDCGQRNQLGGGKGIYNLGMDQYLDYNSDTTLQLTGDVLLSATKGVIHANDGTTLTVTFIPS